MLRARFDATREEKDMRKLAVMLEEGEEELKNRNPTFPMIFKNDPDGICYHRDNMEDDRLLDEWHPWEKVVRLTL